MKYLHSAIKSEFLLLILFGAISASAQQHFQLSSKFYEASFVGGKFWNGQHRFGNVFCLTFPRSKDAESLAEATYNNNALYYSRATYPDMTAIYVVTSTVPVGRTVEVEIDNLASQNQKTFDAFPLNFKQSRVTGLLGPSLTLTVRNSREGTKEGPFPLMRPIAIRPDGQLGSLSVHRLFVRGHDRIEVAALRYFKTPIRPDGEAEAIAALSELVETTADSLQSCTASLPPRSP